MEVAVDISGLSVTFKTQQGPVNALQDLSLRIERGQVFGFLGPNGAGKTTAIHVLLGFTEAQSGTARIFGMDTSATFARERIGYLAENPDTYTFLTGRELLRMAGNLFRMPRKTLADRIHIVLEQTNIAHIADRHIVTYSRGQRQRICLAQALLNDPDLLILDEPTGGLDPVGRMEIRRVISSLSAAGKTVFFSSHELGEVELVCDHIAILSGGRLVAEGATDKLVPPGESLERYFLRMVTTP